MNVPYLIGSAIALFIFFVVRGKWVLWKIEEYKINSLWFCYSTKQDAETVRQMSEIYPLGHIILEAWSWDFRKYVVYQGLYDEMMEFVQKELEKDNLKLDIPSTDENNGSNNFGNN